MEKEFYISKTKSLRENLFHILWLVLPLLGLFLLFFTSPYLSAQPTQPQWKGYTFVIPGSLNDEELISEVVHRGRYGLLKTLNQAQRSRLLPQVYEAIKFKVESESGCSTLKSIEGNYIYNCFLLERENETPELSELTNLISLRRALFVFDRVLYELTNSKGVLKGERLEEARLERSRVKNEFLRLRELESRVYQQKYIPTLARVENEMFNKYGLQVSNGISKSNGIVFFEFTFGSSEEMSLDRIVVNGQSFSTESLNKLLSDNSYADDLLEYYSELLYLSKLIPRYGSNLIPEEDSIKYNEKLHWVKSLQTGLKMNQSESQNQKQIF